MTELELEFEIHNVVVKLASGRTGLVETQELMVALFELQRSLIHVLKHIGG